MGTVEHFKRQDFTISVSAFEFFGEYNDITFNRTVIVLF